jgi:hypothetical protein
MSLYPCISASRQQNGDSPQYDENNSDEYEQKA